MKAFLLEDFYALRRYYTRTLNKSGFEVSETRKLREAATLLENETFDLYVCDVELSDGDTWKIIQDIAGSGARIIAISTEPEHEVQCRAIGINHFMIKPFPVRALTEKINDIFTEQPPVSV